MKLKKDEGVSSVVAIMLILAVLVIGISLFMGIYLPDLKETSEIQNSEQIRDVFLSYATTIDGAYSTQQSGYYSWVLSLGAGDVLLSPSKSSGTFELKNNHNNISITYDESASSIDCKKLDITYIPTISYWSDLGYEYSNGVVKVKKDSGKDSGNRSVEYLTLTNSKNGYFVNGDTLTVIDFDVETGSNFKSGSGTATLTLKIEKDTYNCKTFVSTQNITIQNITINSSPTTYGISKIIVLNATVSIK
ncbi:MAG TPA: hypothetical protein O0W79_04385 [Methanocorpusculum sp.]|nr:hypothetical protein [Methanocorpusculum sp.]